MPRWWRLASPVAAILPVPAAIVAVELALDPAGAAAWLLLAVLAATLVGGTAVGLVATVLTAYLFDVNIIEPGSALSLGPRALAGVAAVTVAAALIAVGVGYLRALALRARAARADFEQRSSQLTAQVEMIAPVLDNCPIGVTVFDTDLRYRYLNRATLAMHELPPGEIVGKRFADLYPANVDQLEPYAREVLRTGEPQLDQLVSTPPENPTRHFRVDRYPIRGTGGSFTGVALTVQDVTERERLAEIQAEADRLRATVEVVFKLEAAQRIARLGTWEADLATGDTRYSTQLQAMIGREGPPEDTSVAGYVHPGDVKLANVDLMRLFQDGTPYRSEYRVLRADGTYFEAICTGDAVPGPDGRPSGLWGTVLDVSDQRRAEREAQEAIRQAEQVRSQAAAEHQALKLVQAAMLPASVPEVDGLELAVAYLPVASAADVGGDWYDAFGLPDGRLAIAVGDVTGHDLRAATIMGQVRNAVRAYALLDPDPGTVLAQTNMLLWRLPDLDLVTMLYGVYDPGTHVLTWARGGHPPPLLYRAGTPARSLDEPSGRLLGASAEMDYPVGRHELAAGETLLWYTDGLIEHPDHDLRRYLDLLRGRRAVSAPVLVADLTGEVIPRIGQVDDICLLALSRS